MIVDCLIKEIIDLVKSQLNINITEEIRYSISMRYKSLHGAILFGDSCLYVLVIPACTVRNNYKNESERIVEYADPDLLKKTLEAIYAVFGITEK